MLIKCKVKPCKQGVLYIAILSSNTGVYTVCHLSYEPVNFSGYALVDDKTFEESADVVDGYLYSSKGILVPKAVLYKDYDKWRIYIPHTGLNTTFSNEPTEKNVRVFLEGLKCL